MECKDAETMEKAIRSLYEAGCPLFTKESIADISQQLKQNTLQVFSVKGLDGKTYTTDLSIEDTQSGEDELEPYDIKAFLHYAPFQELITWADPCVAYCPLQVRQRFKLRHKITKCPIPPPLKVFETTEEVERHLTASLKTWENSEPCRRLKSTLIEALTAPVKVSKVIGFACASVAEYEPLRLFLHSRSLVQHALLLTMKNLLETLNGHEKTIECYAQDPSYLELDRAALEKFGITVLEDPEAFLEVDDSSFVFSCGANVPVRQIIADIARPAIIIWDRVKEYHEGEDYMLWTDPDSSRLRQMIKDHYQEFEFPADPDHFFDMAIYIRKMTETFVN